MSHEMEELFTLLTVDPPAPEIEQRWALDFNAGMNIDRDMIRAWTLARFDAVAYRAAPRSLPGVRHAAVFALGSTHDPRAVPVLLDVLIADEDRYDHDFVYMAFASLGSSAVPALIAAAGGKRTRSWAALTCLGNVRDVPLAIWRTLAPGHRDNPAFYNALFNQNRAEILSIAMFGLGRPKVRPDALAAVSFAVDLATEEEQWPDDVDRRVLADAVAAGLARDGHLASRDPDASSWEWSLSVLSTLADPRGYAAAARALDDPRASESARRAAVGALGRFGTKEAQDRLHALLSSKDPIDQVGAAEVLDDEDALRTALALAAELRVDHEAWGRAIEIVGRDPSGLTTLAKWIDPDHPRARRSRRGIHGVAHLAWDRPELLQSLPPAALALVDGVRARWDEIMRDTMM